MGGVQFDLHISQPELYFFLWEINGRPGGHTPQIADCHCGQEASIRVMRLSDGISVTRSLSLPPCIEKMDY